LEYLLPDRNDTITSKLESQTKLAFRPSPY